MIKVTFGLSKAKYDIAIFSRIIMATEKRPYSHVYIRFEEPFTKKDVVFHAAKGMLHFCSFTNFSKTNTVIKEYEVSFTQKEFLDLLGYMHENSGVRYSYLQILSISIQKIFRLKKGFIDNDEKEQICSELAVRVLKMAGFSYKVKPEDDITPSDFDGWMEFLADVAPERVKLKSV